MGVQAFPGCFSQGKPLGLLCRTFAEVLGDVADSPFVQNILYQASYFREQHKVGGKAYLKNSAIAVNENIFWVETSGDHLQFTGDELMGWVEKYFMNSEVTV